MSANNNLTIPQIQARFNEQLGAAPTNEQRRMFRRLPFLLDYLVHLGENSAGDRAVDVASLNRVGLTEEDIFALHRIQVSGGDGPRRALVSQVGGNGKTVSFTLSVGICRPQSWGDKGWTDYVQAQPERITLGSLGDDPELVKKLEERTGAPGSVAWVQIKG